MKFITNHWTRNTYPFAWRLGWRLTKTKPSDWTYLMYCLRKVCLSSICHASSLWCRGWLTGESVGVTTGLFFKPSWLFVLIALRLDTDWPELCLERCDEWKVQFWWFSNTLQKSPKNPLFLEFWKCEVFLPLFLLEMRQTTVSGWPHISSWPSFSKLGQTKGVWHNNVVTLTPASGDEGYPPVECKNLFSVMHYGLNKCFNKTSTSAEL